MTLNITRTPESSVQHCTRVQWAEYRYSRSCGAVHQYMQWGAFSTWDLESVDPESAHSYSKYNEFWWLDSAGSSVSVANLSVGPNLSSLQSTDKLDLSPDSSTENQRVRGKSELLCWRIFSTLLACHLWLGMMWGLWVISCCFLQEGTGAPRGWGGGGCHHPQALHAGEDLPNAE